MSHYLTRRYFKCRMFGHSPPVTQFVLGVTTTPRCPRCRMPARLYIEDDA